MVQTTIQRRQSCIATDHGGHLCQLTDQYFHIREPQQFRKIVSEPRYACEFCGRTAHVARNLCYPLLL
ncbi:MAG: hypothetical protein ACM3VT_01630 [Solirubrobacterales bacterium]